MRRLLLVLLLGAVPCFGQQPEALQILGRRCLSCHSAAQKSSGLDLSSRATAVRGGDRGPAIVPGKPLEGMLTLVLRHHKEPHMPMGGPKLPESEIAALEAWIKAGAEYGVELGMSQAAEPLPPLPDHWSFKLPQRPPVPVVQNDRWVRNPIDAFVAAEHGRRNLTPLPEIDRGLLLRRVYLDLIGVPPTRAELKRFLADASPDAYEAMVDRLLADKRYGERWARHWMDIWRYSDWYGWFEGNDVRYSQRFMWRWRDWIIESLNEDKGYDRMAVEMLAADEIAPGDPNTLRATGFLARNYSKYDRDGWMQDAVDHTALGMLGLTVKCARCHDHKYDPVSQEEYYRFRAFFEPYEVRVDRVPGEVDVEKDGLARVYDSDDERPTYLYIRGNVQEPEKDKPLTPGTPRLFETPIGPIDPVSLPVDSYYPDHRPFVQKDLIAKAKADVDSARQGLDKKQADLAAVEAEVRDLKTPQGYEKLRAASDELALAKKTLAAAEEQVKALGARIAADNARFSEPPAREFETLAVEARKAERQAGILKADENLLRAKMDFDKALAAETPDEEVIAEARKRIEAAAAALTQAPEGYHTVGKVFPSRSTGRRTALARWIASPQNPLTARVAINHMWLRHFGRPLVPTVFDFGLNGKPPTHPELLDWLATEFINSGWSMKTVHRLMVTSAAYRMASSAGELNHPNTALDPDNDYLWRMNPRRMEAEVVRDSLLSMSGELDATMGGPVVDHHEGAVSNRRSIYFRHSPDTQMTFLRTFDGPNPAECYARNESVAPQQALALVNSEISVEQSRVLAAKIGAGGDADSFVEAAFETMLGRLPSAEERATAMRFLERQPARLVSWEVSAPANLRARENLVHVLLNHNDFVTVR